MSFYHNIFLILEIIKPHIQSSIVEIFSGLFLSSKFSLFDTNELVFFFFDNEVFYSNKFFLVKSVYNYIYKFIKVNSQD